MDIFYGLYNHPDAPPERENPEPPSANSEVARQRARVDALIAWTVKALDELNEHVGGPLDVLDLDFPDPYPSEESKQSQSKAREERKRKAEEQTESDRRRARAILEMLND